MEDEGAARIRSVMVDGSARGRVEDPVTDLAVSDDGRHAYVAHRSPDGRRNLATRCSLEDGRRVCFASSPRLGRHHLWRVTPSGRVFDLPPGGRTLTWRDPDGRTGALPLGAKERVHGIDGDGRLAVCVRAGGERSVLRVADVEGGSTRCEVEVPANSYARDAVGGRFVVHEVGFGEFRRVRLADGDVGAGVRVSTSVRDDRPSYVVDREVARVALLCRDRAWVHSLDGMEVLASLDAGDGAEVEDLVGDRLLARTYHTDDSAMLYDLAAGSSIALGFVSGPRLARLTPDAGRVVHVSGCVVRVHELPRGRPVPLHDGPDSPAKRVAWSRDGARLAVVCADATVRVLDVRAGAVAWTFERPPSPNPYEAPMRVEFSPDGRALHAVWRTTALTWSLTTGQEVWRAPMPKGEWSGVAAVSPDGRWLATVYVPDDRDPWRRQCLVLFDLDAGTCTVSGAKLPRSRSPLGMSLRFAGEDALEFFVRHANHPGEVAVVGLGLDGVPTNVARRGFHAVADVLPQDDGRVLVRDRGRWCLASPRDPRPEWRTATGVVLDAALDAHGGLAAFGVHDGERAGLLVLDAVTGAPHGLVWTMRCAVGGAFSPEGYRLAVLYADGGVEVFALDP